MEEWRAVVGYEGQYEVSDQGRVRSLRLRNWRANKLRPEPLIRRLETSPDGYRTVTLGGCDPTQRQPQRRGRVHVLVLEAFVGPRPPGHQGAHLNGRPDDNRLVNLRWVTQSENQGHRRVHGTARLGDENSSRLHPERLARGESNGNAKLTADAVRAIRAAIRGGEIQASIAARYGVGLETISLIARGKTWRHVTES